MRLAALTIIATLVSFGADAKSMLCNANIDDAKGADIQQQIHSAMARCKEEDAVMLRVSTVFPADMLQAILDQGAAGQYCDFRYPVTVAVGPSLRKGGREGSLRCIALGYKRDLRQ